MINRISGWALCLDGKFWGSIYNDGHSSEDGWTDDIDKISIDSESKDMPSSKTWFTYSGSHYEKEMQKGEWRYIEVVKTFRLIK